QRIFADYHIRQDGCSRSNRHTLLDQRHFDLPIRFSLKYAYCARCPRKRVVDKGNVVSNKDFVFNRDPFTNERMARYFAPAANFGILLNLNKCPNFCIVTNLATVEVVEFRELYILPKLNVRRDVEISVGLRIITLWVTAKFAISTIPNSIPL